MTEQLRPCPGSSACRVAVESADYRQIQLKIEDRRIDSWVWVRHAKECPIEHLTETQACATAEAAIRAWNAYVGGCEPESGANPAKRDVCSNCGGEWVYHSSTRTCANCSRREIARWEGALSGRKSGWEMRIPGKGAEVDDEQE